MHPDLPLGALLSLLHRSHMIALNRRLEPLGLTAGQVPFLLYLARREGSPQEALARHFHLDKATVARGVQRLERDGFLVRRVEPEDRRAYGLFLTERGRGMVEEILRLEACWEEEMLGTLAEREREDAIRLLRTLAEQSMRITGMVSKDESQQQR